MKKKESVVERVPARRLGTAFVGTLLVSSLAAGANAVVAQAEEQDASTPSATGNEQLASGEEGTNDASGFSETANVVSVDSTAETGAILEPVEETAMSSKDGASEVPAPEIAEVAAKANALSSDVSEVTAEDATDDVIADVTSTDNATSTEDVVPEGIYTITCDAGSHYALDVASGSKGQGANVQLYEQNGTDAQHWQLTYDRDKASKTYGMVRLTNVNSGKALDVSGGSAKSGANVQQYDANGTLAQWWSLVQDEGASGTSGFMLRSALGYNLVLDVSAGRMANGSNVQLYNSNDTKAQRFSFVALADEQADTWLSSGVSALAKEHADDLADGTYVVSASGALRSVLDVASGSKGDGANVQVYADNSTGAQRWAVSTVTTSDGTPWKVLTNVNSGKVLDVSGGSASSGTNVWQYASNGTSSQRWAIVSNGNGTYTLRSALAHNLVVDLSSGRTSNGTNVQTWTSNGTAAQKFIFTLASPMPIASNGAVVSDGLYVISASNGKVVDVPSGSKSNGQQLQTYASNGTQAQGFAVTYDSASGYYHITNVHSNASVDLDNGDVLAGGKVQQYSYGKSNHNQMWLFQSAGNDAWKIISPYANLGISLTSDGKLTTSAISSATTWKLSSYVLSDGMYVIGNLGNGQVMDVTGGSWSTNTQIQTYASNDTLAQKWYLRRDASNSSSTYPAYTIQSVSSGKYLASSGSSVVQLPYGKAASWRLGYDQGVGFVLNEISSGLRVAADSKLVLTKQTGLAVEGWSFTSDAIDFSGGYELASALNDGYRLDVASGSKDSEANVQLYGSNGTNAQRWTISSNGNGWFAIFSVNSGKVLDVAGGSTNSGTNVQQYTSNESKAQEWTFKMGDYGLVLVSRLGNVASVKSGSATNGSNVVVEIEDGSERECWLLKPVTVTLDSGYLIAIDPGHGGSDPGASGNGLTESTLTWKIALSVRDRLVANGVQVYLTRNQNEYVSVKGRVDRAVEKGAKAIVSVHIDSADASSAHGASILTPNDSSYNYNLHKQGRQLGSYILSNISNLGISSRGYLERNYDDASSSQYRYADGSVADYYGIVRYARQNGMLGIIVEHGFITNPGDASKFSSDSFLTKLGQADADGIISMYGKGGNGAKASSGSVTLASAKGFSSDDATANAATGTPTTVTIKKAAAKQTSDSIMGTSQTSAAQIARYFDSKGKSYPSSTYTSKGAATISDFAQIVMEEAAAENVRAEVVFCQAMYETGWLQFGGLVTADKCNFAGLGATGKSSDPSTNYGTGYSYANVRTGIRAQVQHLKAYASTDGLNNACVDQRFGLVTRGSAPTVESLSGKWAVPGNGYGEAILKLVQELLAS